MAASKRKAPVARPSGKKGSARKPVRGPKAQKRTKKATTSRGRTVKAPRPIELRAEPLFRPAELVDGGPRKPVKKMEVARPARPPAQLPIPQSTFFF